MKKYKLTDKGKKLIIALLLCALIIVSILGINLYNHLDFGTSIIDNAVSNNIKVVEKVKAADNGIIHTPNLIKVEAEFKKKVTNTYKPVQTPNLPAGSKYCVLTFDDGPGFASTQKILNVLAKYNIKATFFMVGERVQWYPQMAQTVANAGHEVANHSYSHPDLTTLSYSGYMSEINKTQNAIASATGQTSTLLRPPYGSYNSDIAANCGLNIALWNVDSLDWSLRNANAIYNNVMSSLLPNSVILFHDIYQFTADAVELIVPALVDAGYTFVTYSEYLQLGA